jgi:SAM-dependent methyltransferase
MAQLIKRILLKYAIGYKREQNYWDTRWKLGLSNDNWDERSRREMIALLADIMAKNGCHSFLDVGCGKAVLREVPGYVGVDFSIESIKRSGLKEAIFADITNHIPLPNKSFDAAFSRTVLLHIPPTKIDRAVSEISRVTKKCLILIEPKYVPGMAQEQIRSFNHDYPTIVRRYFDERVIFLFLGENGIYQEELPVNPSRDGRT